MYNSLNDIITIILAIIVLIGLIVSIIYGIYFAYYGHLVNKIEQGIEDLQNKIREEMKKNENLNDEEK
jgi:predicted PurR-regulated permease PerM